MVSLSESVTAMPFLHFLEDEFGEVEKILLCREPQNSSVCVHRQHRIHQYVFINKRVDIWKHVRRIGNHDVPDRGMNAECTHVCVYRLDDGGDGEKCFCNTPLKVE